MSLNLFRIGSYGVGTDPTTHQVRRWLFTETWATSSLPDDAWWSRNAHYFGGWYGYPYGTYGPPCFGQLLVQQLRPYPTRTIVAPNIFATGPMQGLGDLAPEAALRLQRVGAAGELGRVCIPIPVRTFYTDVPHCRHINVPLVQGYLNQGIFASASAYTFDGITCRRVIFSRSTETAVNVVSYRLLANPVRIWRRWRRYDATAHTPPDTLFIPNPHG